MIEICSGHRGTFIGAFYFLLLLGSLGCVTPAGNPSAPAEAPTVVTSWAQAIELLNQDPQPHTLRPFYSASLEADLTAISTAADRNLKDLWQKQKPADSQMSRRERRLQRNVWYHRQVQNWNEPLVKKLTEIPEAGSPISDHSRVAASVWEKVRENPVARLDNVRSYPQGNQVGYCFGRAMLVHLRLLQAGVPQKDIAKIFTLGDLLVGQELWRFHVAVMVRDPRFGFVVVDPLQNKVLAIGKWLDVNRDYGVKRPYSRVRFFVTDPRKFVPGLGRYDLEQLQNPALKPYFEDLAKTL
mgnify:CR=1 FL=1